MAYPALYDQEHTLQSQALRQPLLFTLHSNPPAFLCYTFSAGAV